LENLTVGTTYGEALYEAARDLGKIDTFREELRDLNRIFSDTPEFFELLKTPTLAGEQKKESARKVFEGRIEKELLNFLCILIDKRRIAQFAGIRASFEKLVDERDGVTSGKIISAVPLSEAQISKFEAETGKLFRKKTKLTAETDASLLGGVRIYVDGKLIDASIRTKLEGLKETLFD
jgi:ATP synthase F1 delta subunit